MRLYFFLIALCGFCFVTSAHAVAERRLALVLGNSAYGIGPLANPKNDAEDLAKALGRLGFEVSLQTDLTIARFDQVLDNFVQAAKGADLALFFYAGHGVQIDKRGYLVPVDLKGESESSALRELVAIQEVVSRIENAAKVSVIILDACRDSPLQERLRRVARDKDRAIAPKGLPPVPVVGSNTLIVYATVPGETASDGAGRNSPLTTAILKNIETPNLEVELMFKRVTADVLEITEGRQQPERLSRLQTEIVFLAPRDAVKDVAKPVEITMAPQPNVEVEFWNSAREGGSIDSFNAYLSRYPDGAFAALARIRIQQLQRKTAALALPAARAPQPDPTAPAAEPGPAVVPGEAILIRKIQTALKDRGCYKGPVNGIWDNASQAALGRYNKAAQKPLTVTTATQADLDGLLAANVTCEPEREAAIPQPPKLSPPRRSQEMQKAVAPASPRPKPAATPKEAQVKPKSGSGNTDCQKCSTQIVYKFHCFCD